MHNTTQRKKTGRGFTLEIPSFKHGNIFPIQMQIDMAKMSRRHDKRRTRNKTKQWRKEV